MNAQWVLYSAPSAIHCLRTCLSDSESGILVAAGGIRSLASSAKIRLTQLAFVGFARDDRNGSRSGRFHGLGAHVKPQFGLPRLVIRAVTLETMSCQDRPDLAREQVLVGSLRFCCPDRENDSDGKYQSELTQPIASVLQRKVTFSW